MKIASIFVFATFSELSGKCYLIVTFVIFFVLLRRSMYNRIILSMFSKFHYIVYCLTGSEHIGSKAPI